MTQPPRVIVFERLPPDPHVFVRSTRMVPRFTFERRNPPAPAQLVRDPNCAACGYPRASVVHVPIRPPTPPQGDEGDEDDTNPSRELARRLTGWRIKIGPPTVYYLCRRLPTLPDHDGGDEEPRLERVFGTIAYLEGI